MRPLTTRELGRALGLSIDATRAAAKALGIKPVREGKRGGQSALWPAESVEILKGRRKAGNPAFQRRGKP